MDNKIHNNHEERRVLFEKEDKLLNLKFYFDDMQNYTNSKRGIIKKPISALDRTIELKIFLKILRQK